MRKLKKGTKIRFGGAVVTLEETTDISFDGDGNEGRFAAMLLQEGEEAFNTNKRSLRLLYNRTNGALLPLEDQTIPKSEWVNLTWEERAKLGITEKHLAEAKAEAEKLEQEKIAAEEIKKAEAEKAHQEAEAEKDRLKAEAEKAETEKAHQAKLEAEQAKQAKKAEVEKAKAEKTETEKIPAETSEAKAQKTEKSDGDGKTADEKPESKK